MRRFGKWVLRVFVVLLLAELVVGLWQREQIMRVLAVNSLFSEAKIVNNFSHMNAAFLSTPVPRGDGPTAEAPQATSHHDQIRAAQASACQTVSR